MKDIWKIYDERIYTIKHIMVQTLNKEQRVELGADDEIIHDE